MSTPEKREASHAGTWYDDDPTELGKTFDKWLAAAPKDKQNTAKVVISPHAGYYYCGATAAHSYDALFTGDETTTVKTVFVLGPSHFATMPKCAVSQFKVVETPFGDIPVNQEIVSELIATDKFTYLDTKIDLKEHSLELQYPFLRRRFGDKEFSVVPILVGEYGIKRIREYATFFKKYLLDPSCVFVISSDFTHWGFRYDFTYINKEWMTGKGATISDSTSRLDHIAAEKIVALDFQGFIDYINKYKSNICGRIAILVIMAALEASGVKPKGEVAHYSQSDEIKSMLELSVSYCSITFSF